MDRAHDRQLHRRSFVRMAAVGALGLVVAGCGGGGGSGTSNDAKTTADMTAPTTGDTLTITMQNLQFAPKVAVARVGQKVVWTNDDDVQHDVRALKGATFQSALFGKGHSYSYTPKRPGTIEYDCSIHPGMVGVLKVVE